MKNKSKKQLTRNRFGAIVCLFVYLSLLMVKVLHHHHAQTPILSVKEAGIASFQTHYKSYQASCKICDYLTNNHSHQLNYSYSLPAIFLDGTSIKYKIHSYCTSPVFILSCANKGPPVL